jgi:hypothetical protein
MVNNQIIKAMTAGELIALLATLPAETEVTLASQEPGDWPLEEVTALAYDHRLTRIRLMPIHGFHYEDDSSEMPVTLNGVDWTNYEFVPCNHD